MYTTAEFALSDCGVEIWKFLGLNLNLAVFVIDECNKVVDWGESRNLIGKDAFRPKYFELWKLRQGMKFFSFMIWCMFEYLVI